MIAHEQDLDLRIRTLDFLGVEPAFRDELIAHNRREFCFDPSLPLVFPWPDEPFVEAWDRYAAAVRRAGTLAALEDYLPQLRFPIATGMSADAGYAAVTRRGAPAALFAPQGGPRWTSPEKGAVHLIATPAGRVPYIYAGCREDFVFLVRALSHRNEPAPVPDSMGACVVGGYNNWDRIEERRRQYVAEHGAQGWPAELKRLTAARVVRDSFLILNGGPYSGVPATATGNSPEEWSRLSLNLRQHHEAAHYFTRRVLGSARNHPCDETIADFYAMTQVFPSFNGLLFLRFFGLEDFPHYRDGGRLQNYRGAPPLSDGAFAGLHQLLFLVAESFEAIDRDCGRDLRNGAHQAALLLTLCQYTIEEMAASGFSGRFQAAFRRIRKLCANRRGQPL